MLVLTRKQGEAVLIAETVEVKVLEIRKGQIKLGIAAPPEVLVHREDVHRRIAGQVRERRSHAHTS